MRHIDLEMFPDEEKRRIKAKILSRIDVSAKGCWLWKKWCTASYGYGMIDITHDNKKHKIRVHRLTYFLWKENPKDLNVLHKCDITNCCNPMHLFLGTQKENLADMRGKKRGSNPPRHAGSRHPFSKVTEEQVLEMRALRFRGCKYREIGKKYGVSETAAHYCVNKGWSHLEKSSLQTRKETE